MIIPPKHKYNPKKAKIWPPQARASFPFSLDAAGAGLSGYKSDYLGNAGPHKNRIKGPTEPNKVFILLENGKLKKRWLNG